MKSVTRLALVDPNDASRSALKTLLLSIDAVWLEAECSRYEFFADVVLQTQPDIALVALDTNPQKGLELLTRLHQDLPACNLLVVSSSQEGSLILQARFAVAKSSPSAGRPGASAVRRWRSTWDAASRKRPAAASP
jgi:pilus assembly protein CpaE